MSLSEQIHDKIILFAGLNRLAALWRNEWINQY